MMMTKKDNFFFYLFNLALFILFFGGRKREFLSLSLSLSLSPPSKAACIIFGVVMIQTDWINFLPPLREAQ